MKNFLFLFFPLLLLTLPACSKPPAYKESNPSAAQQKLVEIVKIDYQTNILTKQIENTLWIYVPLEEDIIEIKATGFGMESSEEAASSVTINYLDSIFETEIFKISYDIGLKKAYPVSYGYGSAYPDKIQDLQRSILTAISRAYGDLSTGGQGPEFVIIVLADIRKGLEARTYLAFEDLIRVMQDPTFTEEYTRRAVYQTPTGNKNLINDREGKYIEYKPLTWSEFLAKQIAHRVSFKFNQSTRKPTDDFKKEILTSANEAIFGYDFRGFDSVLLRDLAAASEFSVDKQKLQDYAPDPKSQGKLHYIEFR